MKNQEIAEIFTRMADILEFKGENAFKVNAYRKAARVLTDLTADIEDLYNNKQLGEIPGIGQALQGKIEDYLLHNRISQYDALLNDIPKELFSLLSIPNFGPRTAALAYQKLGVQTLADLEKVIQNGDLVKLPGMGEKKVDKIHRGLELIKVSQTRISIAVAQSIIDQVISWLGEKAGTQITRITAAGSARRGKETVHGIDILAETPDGAAVLQLFTQMPNVTEITGAGDTKASVILENRYQVDLRAIPAASYGAALQYFTGSQAHNIKLRGIARDRGLKINEYGIFNEHGKIGGEQEEDIYRLLGMPWIEPELREDRGEIEAALQNRLPHLVTLDDIKADLHIHSTYSDGQLSVAEMAETIRSLGYQYMAFCDHSRSAFYANGLDENRLLQQLEEIRRLNERYSDFAILAGTETDILPDGSLDFPDHILKKLDFVIASIHSAFETDPTGRTIAAMKNPYVDVIGHPTGRLISRREGFALDIDRVIAVAAETGTALEINSYWDRLDLSDLHVKRAIEQGVKICINTDSHQAAHLTMMEFGVATARRGWAECKDIINTLPLEQFRARQKRNR
ncbi:MAG TPA: DNA polymerase/3'-5' exonuclease PolX [bacterium]|nr:DNA polymerase/3'-5' exonuclease PolX [bacterium]HPN43290.1 DNA polymerase/3'-5' exonuclease PolX [bacterium]